MPKHVAIIMDGNGRWATKNNLPIISGHRAGAKSAKAIIQHAAHCSISYLTLYAFSHENWKRNTTWIHQFFEVLQWYLEEEMEELFKNQVCLKVIGDVSKFPPPLQKLLRDLEEKTKDHKTITVLLALGYGGRNEILRAIQKLDPEKVLTEEIFRDSLDTGHIPDPDLLIRTSGEMRLSNFLLWQLAYTELYFSPKFWPDFSLDDFDQALHDFRCRTRRFGKE